MNGALIVFLAEQINVQGKRETNQSTHPDVWDASTLHQSATKQYNLLNICTVYLTGTSLDELRYMCSTRLLLTWWLHCVRKGTFLCVGTVPETVNRLIMNWAFFILLTPWKPMWFISLFVCFFSKFVSEEIEKIAVQVINYSKKSIKEVGRVITRSIPSRMVGMLGACLSSVTSSYVSAMTQEAEGTWFDYCHISVTHRFQE